MQQIQCAYWVRSIHSQAHNRSFNLKFIMFFLRPYKFQELYLRFVYVGSVCIMGARNNTARGEFMTVIYLM